MAFFGKKDYLKDIERTDQGDLVYTGDIYRPEGEGLSAYGRFIPSLLAAAALFVGSGSINAAGASDAFYVILPYIGEALCLFIACWNVYKLLSEKGRVRAFVYEKATKRIPGLLTVLSATALIGCAASAVYLIRNGMGENAAKSIAYPVIKILTALAAFYGQSAFRKIVWKKDQR